MWILFGRKRIQHFKFFCFKTFVTSSLQKNYKNIINERKKWREITPKIFLSENSAVHIETLILWLERHEFRYCVVQFWLFPCRTLDGRQTRASRLNVKTSSRRWHTQILALIVIITRAQRTWLYQRKLRPMRFHNTVSMMCIHFNCNSIHSSAHKTGTAHRFHGENGKRSNTNVHGQTDGGPENVLNYSFFFSLNRKS